MPDEEFTIALFYRVDTAMKNVGKHPQAKLYPSEVVTIGIAFALKGVGPRAFYRWSEHNFKHLFPNLLERTRLFRAFKSHRCWLDHVMAEPSLIGLADNFGIELLHPRRGGRSEQQIGRKGYSNQRWIVGGKLCVLLNHLGLVVDWDCDTANMYDGSAFQDLIDGLAEQMIVFADVHFIKKEWHPTNLRPCKRGEWNSRMLVETVLSMLTTICHFKRLSHRIWDYFEMHLAYTMTMFNILVQWHGLETDDDGYARLSIAQFSL